MSITNMFQINMGIVEYSSIGVSYVSTCPHIVRLSGKRQESRFCILDCKGPIGGKRGIYEAEDPFNLNESSAGAQILDPGIRFNQTTDIL